MQGHWDCTFLLSTVQPVQVISHEKTWIHDWSLVPYKTENKQLLQPVDESSCYTIYDLHTTTLDKQDHLYFDF